MANNVTIGINTYTVPDVGERSWGADVTNLLVELVTQANKVATNTYTLTSQYTLTDSTGNFGITSNHYSGNGNISSTGILRIANPSEDNGTTVNTGVAWRNSANDGDLILTASSDTELSFAGIEQVNLSSVQTLINKTLTSPVLDGTISGTAVLDEDDMVSNSDQHLATQQSIKAYVDTEISTAIAANDQLEELSNVTLTNNTPGTMLVYQGSTFNQWATRNFSGAFTNDENLVATLANDLIVDANINAAAAIAWTKISKAGSSISDLANHSHTELDDIGTNTHDQIDTHIASTSNPHSVTKAQVGLSDVDNTSDANKPISTATQTALDGKEPTLTANQKVDHSTVSITGTGALTGGGDITASRSIDLDIDSKTDIGTPAGNDSVLIYDDSAGDYKKVFAAQLGGSGEGGLNFFSKPLTPSIQQIGIEIATETSPSLVLSSIDDTTRIRANTASNVGNYGGFAFTVDNARRGLRARLQFLVKSDAAYADGDMEIEIVHDPSGAAKTVETIVTSINANDDLTTIFETPFTVEDSAILDYELRFKIVTAAKDFNLYISEVKGDVGISTSSYAVKTERKFLSQNQTNNGEMTDLTFTNLVPGRRYKYHSKFYLQVNNGSPDVQITVTAQHDSSTINTMVMINRQASSTAGDHGHYTMTDSFIATGNDLRFVAASASNNSFIGAGTTNTYVLLEEIEEINQLDEAALYENARLVVEGLSSSLIVANDNSFDSINNWNTPTINNGPGDFIGNEYYVAPAAGDYTCYFSTEWAISSGTATQLTAGIQKELAAGGGFSTIATGRSTCNAGDFPGMVCETTVRLEKGDKIRAVVAHNFTAGAVGLLTSGVATKMIITREADRSVSAPYNFAIAQNGNAGLVQFASGEYVPTVTQVSGGFSSFTNAIARYIVINGVVTIYFYGVYSHSIGSGEFRVSLPSEYSRTFTNQDQIIGTGVHPNSTNGLRVLADTTNNEPRFLFNSSGTGGFSVVAHFSYVLS